MRAYSVRSLGVIARTTLGRNLHYLRCPSVPLLLIIADPGNLKRAQPIRSFVCVHRWRRRTKARQAPEIAAARCEQDGMAPLCSISYLRQAFLEPRLKSINQEVFVFVSLSGKGGGPGRPALGRLDACEKTAPIVWKD